MARRLILVGTGGFGASWCRKFLPPNIVDGLSEVAAAIASSRSRQPVRVQELLAQTSDRVRVDNGSAAHP